MCKTNINDIREAAENAVLSSVVVFPKINGKVPSFKQDRFETWRNDSRERRKEYYVMKKVKQNELPALK